ncbi:pentapeptide repeat-containing protein [Saccharothrix syringae]|uniref:Pentapeptide repeat-containing protein n=1 Tax=Saccharothrix syringae TaxID=103733 RepID=A0A5Q0H1I6_SACSY|nr:pentapeptide repeat-containing protein [Saccharothrix syringae]QFZ19963.1 pentapeptide repeat-containing protein [Saccharothrix syringae]
MRARKWLVVAGAGLLVVQLVLLGAVPSWAWLTRWWPALAGVLVLLVAVVLVLRGGGAGEGRPHDWQRTTGLVTALTAVGALVFTGLSLRSTQQQVAVAEQAQLTDRYLRAVEQLANEGEGKVHLRIGGIYALGRVAVDSPRDQGAVEELLAAFVRDRSPRHAGSACPETPVDVQAAFAVLARRAPQGERGLVDLRDTCLTKVSAPEANLDQVSLAGADLTDANLYHAQMGLTSFVNATLVRVRFDSARFDAYTFVEGADLTGADLRYADLSGVRLERVNLSGADLTEVKHEHADVSGAIKNAKTVGAWW